ncbi:MAG: DbpA RNA binding domain-containing protein, partial [Flavobacteriales bacterium]
RSDRKVGNAKKSGRTESVDRDFRKERKRGGSEYSRYFINIGSMDDVSKSELLHFLADVSGIKRKCFGQISLQKNCAYFDVDSKKDKHISDSFIGLEIEGREIRVNRDHDGKPRSRPFSSKNGRNGRCGYDRTNKHQRRRK